MWDAILPALIPLLEAVVAALAGGLAAHTTGADPAASVTAALVTGAAKLAPNRVTKPISTS